MNNENDCVHSCSKRLHYWGNKDPTKKDEHERKGKELLKITRSQKARKAV